MNNINNVFEKAIVVGINTGNDELFNYQFNETCSLCEALNIEVVDTLIQNLPHFNVATYLGKGKLEELKNLTDVLEPNLVVFNDDLSPVQLRNITDYLECEVLDRTMLILEIFKIRAKTKEATLQVEIANLNYTLPRLVGMHNNLSRIGGGGGGAAGARRGSGETKLELDRRHIERKIIKAKGELEDIVKSRQTSRKSRANNGVKTVAFVGYTNAGKSSTINTLLSIYKNEDELKQVFVKDMLFATLETSTRAIKLPNNKEFLVTDTVGFVSKLPHYLVESFKSTLEEINEASLIIHLIDSTSPYMELQIETTNKVLKELGVKDIPILYAYNKVDKLPNKMFVNQALEPSILLSSVTQEGYKELCDYIEKTLFPDFVEATLLIPYDKGNIYNILCEKANVISTEYLNEGILVCANMSTYLYNLYKEYEKNN